MYAGTLAVSVSLWSVESQATQQFNQAFFNQLKEKLPLAKSLRLAKLAMLKGELGTESGIIGQDIKIHGSLLISGT